MSAIPRTRRASSLAQRTHAKPSPHHRHQCRRNVAMPKPDEIVAALADVSAVDSYETLQAELVDLFADPGGPHEGLERQASRPDHAKDGGDGQQRPLRGAGRVRPQLQSHSAHVGHLSAYYVCVRLRGGRLRQRPRLPARNMLDELRGIDLDHPYMQKAIEEIKLVFK